VAKEICYVRHHAGINVIMLLNFCSTWCNKIVIVIYWIL